MAEICPIGFAPVGTQGVAPRGTTPPASRRNCSTRLVQGLTARLQSDLWGRTSTARRPFPLLCNFCASLETGGLAVWLPANRRDSLVGPALLSDQILI